ncbi:hypothetical protein VTK73DRAFT_6988 [Phialemonium thermophilum]|uniref:Secreted protein n=1 Tax=Phialemonium thermophilum TaxID=223376 RepID=A0ABR3WHC8_9PEZI
MMWIYLFYFIFLLRSLVLRSESHLVERFRDIRVEPSSHCVVAMSLRLQTRASTCSIGAAVQPLPRHILSPSANLAITIAKHARLSIYDHIRSGTPMHEDPAEQL